MSAESDWISKPSSTMEQMRERWIVSHRGQGHEPYAAPTQENPERWECECDPDAVWTAVWRILTPDQIRQKFAHLSKRPALAPKVQRSELQAHIAKIEAEQEAENAELHRLDVSHIHCLRVRARYSAGRPRVT
ncbi:hypothetical protein A5760_19610 [Mycobacterium colombiense]|uniref:Uncharacterized protein n=1 Tax=Mycobacterium colombiense TaxID=339268 RepID=A0A1A0VAS7_9MYCO|nr:hypothetical protein [Mycobacterium colombiense]OBB80296.1 hypothetical protein A5760_19610 [Mycobacterium colombiense]